MITLRKLIRYAAVSVVATTISQTVLAVLVGWRITGAVTANVIATIAGTGPSFELNRRWVWRKTGQRSLRGEVVPFAIISATGLALSTIAVAITEQVVDGYSDTSRTIIIELASLTAFGIVWLVQFVVLDRILFRHHATAGSLLVSSLELATAGEAQAVADPAHRLDEGRLVVDIDLVS